MTERFDLPAPNAPNFNERVREVLSTYLGYRGNKLNRGLTVGDLSEAGLIALRAGFLTGSGGARPVAGAGAAVEAPREPDLTPPPMPSGFTLTGGVANFFIGHDAPIYTQGHGHARTVVYATTYSGGALPTFDNAVKITEFTGTVHAHPSNPTLTWLVWLKWQSVDGVLSAAPAGGTNGLAVTTAQDVSTLVTALTGQVTQAQLYTDLANRINLIDAPTTGLVAQQGAVNGTIATVQARISALESTADYNNGTTYSAGAIVKYGGGLYKAIATTTGNLPTNTAYWLKIGDYASLGDAVAAHTVSLADHETRITTNTNGLTAEISTRTALAATVTGNNANAMAAITTEATTRANADTTLSTRVDTVVATVTGNNANAMAAITTEATTRANADTANANRSTALEATVNNASTGLVATRATLLTNYSTTAVTNAAIASSTATVAARLNSGGDTFTAVANAQTTASAKNANFVQSTAPTATKLDDLWIDSASSNVLKRWNGSAWVLADDARIGSTASSLTTLSSKVDSPTTGNNPTFAAVQTEITTRATQTGALFAQYTVKTDVAGLVSGYGLASTAVNAAPSSSFGVRANSFFVAPPSVSQSTAPVSGLYVGYVWLDTSGAPAVTRYWGGAAWTVTPPALPFSVQTTGATVNGVSVPAGVYINDGYIRNGTITNAKIGNAAIDDAKIANLSASKITAGSIAVGQHIQSASYVAGTSGWRINGDGTAELANATVRGAVFATSGFIGGITVEGNNVRAGQTAYNTGQGFFLGSSGVFSLGNSGGNRLTWDGANLNVVSPGLTLNNGAASFSGALSAATGTFAGSLTAATGTFAGSLTAATGTFAGNVHANTLSTNGGRFQVYADGSVVADNIDIRRRIVLQNGSTDTNTYVSGFDGGGYYQPGTVFTSELDMSVLSDVYDLNALSTANNQPYYVAAWCNGPLRNWNGVSECTFTLQIFARHTVNRTYSNSTSYADDGRIAIKFYYHVTLRSGSFYSFQLPIISWTLFKL